MKSILKLEEFVMLVISVYALYLYNSPWWCYLLMALGPDISMIGYAGGNKMGAFLYNLFHHKAVAIIIFSAGLILNNRELAIAGIILFGHSSMDRVFGYGLKLNEGFKFTHLGSIEKPKK